MTYPDPKRVKANRLQIRLDQYENNLIQALAEYSGVEPAALVRELAIRQALNDLCLPAYPKNIEELLAEDKEQL